jgi:hypothetical protein
MYVCIPRYTYDISITVRYPDRFEWKDGLRTDRKGELIWYIDGSKTSKGTGAMVQGGNLISPLGSTPQYSRQKCLSLRHAW